MLRLADLGCRGDEAQVIEHRLGLAHLGGDRAIADRLPRLPFQGVDLGGELANHVFQPLEIVLGGAQPQFGLVAARMQAGNAGRLLQHHAPLGGLCLDDLADPPLMHQRRRARRRSRRRRTAHARRGRAPRDG